ncbi:MAG: NAD(P)-dependent oxidoreductase [Bacteroidota bacterium]
MEYIITGAAGFIGSHLIEYLQVHHSNDKIFVLDKIPPKNLHCNTEYIYCDINESISIKKNFNNPILIHLAALCKEPGYSWEEYFVTNYLGTKNICQFAIDNNVNNIIFTSTMMVFKSGEKRNTEEDITAPDTAYGISKLLAEEVLFGWEKSHKKHRLRIIRPGVVFGKGENGNFSRLARALKFNLFVYVGKRDTIKGSVYVKDVVRALLFLQSDSKERILYNVVFPKPDTIGKICSSICKVMGWRRFVPVAPFRLLLGISYTFELLNSIGLKNPIHHRRIEKLFYSTHLSSDALLESGFTFSYSLESALSDWKKDCNNIGLL